MLNGRVLERAIEEDAVVEYAICQGTGSEEDGVEDVVVDAEAGECAGGAEDRIADWARIRGGGEGHGGVGWCFITVCEPSEEGVMAFVCHY